jgi:hypothetical protein
MSSFAESEWLRSNASRPCQHTLQHWRRISPTGEYRQYKDIEILSRRYSTMTIKRTTLFETLTIEKSQCRDGAPVLSSCPVLGPVASPEFQGIIHPAGGSALAGMVPHIEIASCQTPLEVQAEAHNKDGEVL